MSNGARPGLINNPGANGPISQGKPRVIHSNGRGQVTAPQVPVVVTYEADYSAYEVRSRRGAGNSPWPLSNKTDHDLLKGELALQYADDPTAPQPTNPNFMAVKAFTALNGLSYDDTLVFAGVVVKEWQHEMNRGDTAVTIYRGGTHTVINSGNHTIPMGYLVYWDYPLTTKDKNRRILSRVRVPGIPATKFTVSLRPLDLEDVFIQFKRVEQAFFDEYSRALQNNQGQPPDWNIPAEADPVRNAVKQAVREQTLICRTEGFNRRPDGADEADRSLESEYSKAIEPLYRYSQWLLAAAGDQDALDWKNQDRENAALTFRQQVKARNKRYLQSEGNLFGDRPRAVMDAPACFLETSHIVAAVLDQYDILRKRCIGTALSTAAPGQKLDILLGYYQA